MMALERATGLLAILKDAEEWSDPCPPDAEIAERLECTEEQVCDAFAFLAAAGMIEWHREVAIIAPRLAEQRKAA